MTCLAAPKRAISGGLFLRCWVNQKVTDIRTEVCNPLRLAKTNTARTAHVTVLDCNLRARAHFTPSTIFPITLVVRPLRLLARGLKFFLFFVVFGRWVSLKKSTMPEPSQSAMEISLLREFRSDIPLLAMFAVVSFALVKSSPQRNLTSQRPKVWKLELVLMSVLSWMLTYKNLKENKKLMLQLLVWWMKVA